MHPDYDGMTSLMSSTSELISPIKKNASKVSDE